MIRHHARAAMVATVLVVVAGCGSDKPKPPAYCSVATGLQADVHKVYDLLKAGNAGDAAIQADVQMTVISAELSPGAHDGEPGPVLRPALEAEIDALRSMDAATLKAAMDKVDGACATS